ncbi:MAG: double zinc ribbon domain-containing protein [Thermoplasmata archaeon]
MKISSLILVFIVIVSSISIPFSFQGIHETGVQGSAPRATVAPYSTPVVYINGTFVINEFTVDPLTGLKGQYGLNNPLVITPTGHLIVQNATLYFLSSVYNRLYLSVSGGNLTVVNGAITVAPDMLGPSLRLSLNMTSGSIYLVNSAVMYSGSLNVSGGSFTAVNTRISGATPNEISTAVRFGLNSTVAQSMVYAPSMNFTGARVYFNGVRVAPLYKDAPVNETGGNVTLAGWGNDLLGMSVPYSPMPLEFVNNFIYSGRYYALADRLDFYIYYTTFTNMTANATSAYIQLTTPTDSYVFYQTPSKVFPVVNQYQVGVLKFSVDLSTIQPIIPPFICYYYLNNTVRTFFQSSVPGNVFILSERVNFITPYNVYNDTPAHVIIFNSSSAYIFNSYLDINYNTNVSSYDTFFATNNTVVYWYNSSIENSSRIVSMPFMVDRSSSIYIYRNAVLNARNFDGTPVADIAVVVKPYDLYTGGYDVTALNTAVWSMLAFNGFSTNSTGRAVIPLLSDILNYNFMPNSLYLGNYNISFLNPVGGYLRNVTISLMHFPLLQPIHNNYVYTIKFNIPDFQLISLTVPQPLIVGRTYSIVATVIVYGGPAQESTSVLFTLKGSSLNLTLGQVSVVLYKNVSSQVSVVLNLAGVPYGYYNITACINPGRTIFETNYINDQVTLPVTVYPDVDFAVLNANVSGRYLYNPVYINFTTDNLGNNKFFSANLQVYYFYNTQKFTVYSGLIPSSPQNFSLSFVPNASGNYYIYIDIVQVWDYNQSNSMYFKLISFNINYYISSVGYLVTKPSVSQGSGSVPVELYAVVNCSVIMPRDIPPLLASFGYNGTQIGMSYVHYIPGLGAVAVMPYTVSIGVPYAFNVTINRDRAYPETNYLDDSSVIFVEVPAITGFVTPPQPAVYNGNVTFTGVVNITSGSLTNATLDLLLGGRHFTFPFHSMFAYSSVSFVLNQSVAVFNITQPNVSLPYTLSIRGSQLGGSSVVLGSGFVMIYHPANVTVMGFGIENYSTSFAVGMYVPFLIKLYNSGGINSSSTMMILFVGNDAVPVYIPPIPAGAVFDMVYNYNLTHTGVFQTKLFGFNTTIVGPIITVHPAVYTLTASSDRTRVMGGQVFNVTVYVINTNASAEYGSPVYARGVLVTLYFAGKTYQKLTDYSGVARFTLTAPTNVSGSVPLKASVAGAPGVQQIGTISVSQPFPVIEFTVAFVAIVFASIGYLAYSFSKKAKMKRRRVCPVCGSSVYEGASVCPVCGSQLTGDVTNCPTCDTIIPKYSKYCPNCGEIFVDDRDRDYMYLSEVKSRYDESMDKIFEEYRNQGKSEADFYKWWLNNPGFVSFRQFLLRAEYENKKKECPNCGAFNDLDATECVNCGKQLAPGYTIPAPILQRFESGSQPQAGQEQADQPQGEQAHEEGKKKWKLGWKR